MSGGVSDDAGTSLDGVWLELGGEDDGVLDEAGGVLLTDGWLLVVPPPEDVLVLDGLDELLGLDEAAGREELLGRDEELGGGELETGAWLGTSVITDVTGSEGTAFGSGDAIT